MGNFKEDIARTEAFIFDVDGVMTDGGMIVTPEGEFIRKFHAKDGYALSYAMKRGYHDLRACIRNNGHPRLLRRQLRRSYEQRNVLLHGR